MFSLPWHIPDAFGYAYFVFIGAGFSTAGVVLLTYRILLHARSLTTLGEVVGWRAESDSDARTGYVQKPIVRFRDRLGRTVEFVAVAGGPDEVLPRGTQLRVRFDPADPSKAVRAGAYVNYALPVGMIASGLACLFATFQAVGR